MSAPTTPTDAPATRAIERRMDLRAAPERVWRALTDAAELSRWFGQRASFTAEVGAEGWFEWEPSERYACRVTAVDPGRRLAYRWARHENVPLDTGQSTLVEWELLPSPQGGTVLLMRESGFEEGRHRTGNAAGWLDELADLAAAVADEPWQAGYRQRYAFRAAPDRLWRALSDPDELRAWQGFTEISSGGVGDDVWVTWPDGHRSAIRIDAFEPPNYVASSHTLEADTPLADAVEVLRTEWFVQPRDDGGSDLLLFEMGYRGPERQAQNAMGWDGYLIPVIRRYLGEDVDAQS
jgi:uncharacterized protein YndB with AHSA1/START domain